MKARKNQEKADKWRRLVQEAEASQEPMVRWCQANGVDRGKLYYWRKKFRDQGELEISKKLQPAAEEGCPEGFIEMSALVEELRADYLVEPALGLAGGLILRVSECVIMVGANTEAKTLSMVLDVIGHA